MPSRRWRGMHFGFAQCERGWGASALSHSLPSVQPERSRRPWESACGDGGTCTSTSLSVNGVGECRRCPTSFPPFNLSVVEGHGNPLAEMAGRAPRLRSVRTGLGRAIERPRSPAKAGAQLRSDRNGSRRRVGGSNRRVANASHEAVRAPATMGRRAPAFAGEQEAWTRKRAVEPSPDRPSRTANAALTRPRSSAPPGRPSR